MIKLEDRIKAWATVGNILKNLSPQERSFVYTKAKAENSWFTEGSVEQAIQGIIRYLEEDKLRKWTARLLEKPPAPRKVGIVMAGNIPLVGFHDLLAVLISGHIVLAKLSSKDTFLIKYVTGLLHEIEPRFQEFTVFAERLNDADAIIATGSDNSAKTFEYYFADIPHIIRKNRSSCAVLNGEESEEELQALGKDFFLYFGLGCRNVSKIYVPSGYNFSRLLDALPPYSDVLNHHKYSNNYDYNKSIYLVNGEPHYDNGFVLLKESKELASPISVIYYEEYDDLQSLERLIAAKRDKIQCIVSKQAWFPNSYPFGKAQEPELWDYADGVNTLEFIQQHL